jgi:tetratricopeptide (TPR) repeat protein
MSHPDDGKRKNGPDGDPSNEPESDPKSQPKSEPENGSKDEPTRKPKKRRLSEFSPDPTDADANKAFADRLMKLEKPERAAEFYQKAVTLLEKTNAPERKHALHMWANALRDLDQHKEAEKKYREVLAIDPQYADAHYRLGSMLERRQRFDEAIKQYQEAIRLWEAAGSTDRRLPLYDWANILQLLKRYEDAEGKFREAIKVDQGYIDAYLSLGVVLSVQERFKDAISQYREVATRAGKDSAARKDALHNQGNALRALKQYEDAEKKYREAIDLDPEYPHARYGLGAVLADQDRFGDAIDQYKKAVELLKEEADCKYALAGWGSVLSVQERFEEAVVKYAEARTCAPKDAAVYFTLGNGLADCGRYREAIAQYDKGIKLDPDDPFLYHNKAHYLFQLGRYEEGWKAWRRALDRYENILGTSSRPKGDPATARYFADVLREIFSDHKRSEHYYKRVLGLRNDDIATEPQAPGLYARWLKRGDAASTTAASPNYEAGLKDDTAAWTGLAILYHQWAKAEDAPPEISVRSSYATRRSGDLLRGQLDKGSARDKFDTLASLADLHIEAQEWTEAKDALALADSYCDESRLRRAEIAARRGLMCFRAEEYTDALKHFRQALQVKRGDLTLRSNFGQALLRSKQLQAAQDEFSRVLKTAPGHIDARLGAAQVCIELADDGDQDQYKLAEEHLTSALGHGRNARTGSKRLGPSEIAEIYYLRGYVRAKQYDAEGTGARTGMLLRALGDFRSCVGSNRAHLKAGTAIEKINKRLRRRVSESLMDVVGPLCIFAAGTFIFLFAQLDFLLKGTSIRARFLPAQAAIDDPKTYAAVTFGALLFMVAGLYLPRLLKLKVAGIELEKTSIDQVSTSYSLDISRGAQHR